MTHWERTNEKITTKDFKIGVRICARIYYNACKVHNSSNYSRWLETSPAHSNLLVGASVFEWTKLIINSPEGGTNV